MIHELLGNEGNPITGKELSRILGIEKRLLEAYIQRERREGYPICACSQGYYMAETPEEINRYCGKLKRQAITIFETRQALIRNATALCDEEEPPEA